MNREKAFSFVVNEVEALKARVIANMRAEGAVASGNTIKSLKVVKYADGVKLVSAQRMPFGTLETGRRGGRIPHSFNMIIYDWMKQKGIHGQPIPYKTERPHKYTPQERGDRSLAWVISKHIKERGTSLYRKGGRNTIYSQEIQKTIDKINAKIVAIMKAEVVQTIKLNNPTTEVKQ